ncbi:MAG TPA: YceI family protein [Methylomirabilota bacterium]|jgi:polyisoprenoid-binding protein YceI|nr:YceI family protein [Methylomirabilota bacterium]
MKQAIRAVIIMICVVLTVPALAAAETWVIDTAHTVSGFTVRHMMITNVTGVFEVTKGAIEYKPGDVNSVKADISIDTKSVNTRIARRDDDLRSDNFFNAERFPNITFKSKRVQNVRPDGFELLGDLTIRDVTKEVVLKVDGPTPPIKDPQGNRRVGANASTTINRKDFGVNWHRVTEAGGAVVGDEVKITIEVQAVEKKG